jgi:hypothetical protein
MEGTVARLLGMFRQEALASGAHEVDLTDGTRFDWRHFLLRKPPSTVGLGIMRFTAEFLYGISDPNRPGSTSWPGRWATGWSAFTPAPIEASKTSTARTTSGALVHCPQAAVLGLCQAGHCSHLSRPRR